MHRAAPSPADFDHRIRRIAALFSAVASHRTSASRAALAGTIHGLLARRDRGAVLRDERAARAVAEQAVDETIERYRQLVALSPDGILIHCDGRYVEANPAAVRQLGGERSADIVGRSVLDFVLPEDQAMVYERIRRTYEEPQVTAHTEVRRRIGDAIRVTETFGIPITHAGKPAALTIYRDITERKQVERRNAAFAALAQRLSATATARDAAQVIADDADALLGWDAFSLYLYAPETDLLHAVLSFDEMAGRRMEVPPSSTLTHPRPLVRQVFDEGGQRILRDTPSAPTLGLIPFGDTARRSASLLFVPVRRGERIIGLLTIQSYQVNAYTADDLATLQILADHCSGALERARAEDALRESEARYRQLFERNPQPMWVYDVETLCFLAVNDAAVARYGYSREEFLAMQILDLRPEDERAAVHAFREDAERPARPRMMKQRTKTGAVIDVEVTAHPAPFADRAARLVLATDVTERRRSERALRHNALHDALTGLPNRVLFMERLTQGMRRGTDGGDRQFAVLYIDLDRFKVVNDSLGHVTGDELLTEAARRLAMCAGPAVLVARLGGDEFALLVEDGADQTTVANIAARIVQAIAVPIAVHGRELVVGASIGIAMGLVTYCRPEEVLRDADTAMYRAKAAGGGRYVVFDAAMHARAIGRLELEAALRCAIDRGEFTLHYQPIVALPSGQMAGLEALIRWERPGSGLVLPEQFISIAEETGLIVPLDRWVLQEACAQLRRWDTQCPTSRGLTVAVNVSARDLAEPDCVESVLATLGGLDPRRVTLEVTERTLVAHADRATDALRALHAAGIHIQLDDFGVGYSSLSYLHRLPITGVKIDRSFVQGAGSVKGDTVAEREIVRAIIAMAHSLGLETTAEGVEAEGQRADVCALGCDYWQGHLFSPPRSAADAGRLLGRWGAAAEMTAETR